MTDRIASMRDLTDLVCLNYLIVLVGGLLVICGHNASNAEDAPQKTKPSATNPLIDLKIPAKVENLDAVKFPLEPSIEERVEASVMSRGNLKKLLDAAGLSQTEQSELTKVAADELVGIVLDDRTGHPLEGVTVDAWHWVPGNQTKTDKMGTFRLNGLGKDSKIEVMFTKEGYGQRVFAKRPTGAQNWVILLSNQTYFEGTITDPDGRPVADATIRATYGPIHADGGVIGEIHTEIRSREDGTYRLFVASNQYELQVAAKGRGVARLPGMKIWHHMARTIPITLEKAIRFEARVIDSVTEKPVEGFVLFKWQPPLLETHSDKQGRIVIDDLVPGRIDLQCGGGDKIQQGSAFYYTQGPFGRWWSPDAINEWQRFDPGQPGPGSDDDPWQRNFDDLSFDLKAEMPVVTIVVEQGVQFSGRVTDPKGQPVEGATVAPARTGSGNSLTGDTRYSVKTDKDGRYRSIMPASNSAQYNLVVHDGDYGQWRNWANGVSKVIQTKPGEKVEDFDLQLTEPAVVRGRVIQNGKPVADREVRTHDFLKMENRYYDPTVKSGADGSFELKFVRPGKHYLQVAPFYLAADKAPGGTIIIEVEAGDVVEDAVLQPAN